MKEQHITGILENAELKNLSAEELAAIETHTADCAPCRKAYQTARASLIILKTRAADTLEPTPFFEARVMNVWRARQKAPAVNKLWQMWQDARLLISALAAAVLLLAVLNFSAAFSTGKSDLLASTDDDYYSADTVFFNQPLSTDDLTDAEVLQQIYIEAEETNDGQ